MKNQGSLFGFLLSHNFTYLEEVRSFPVDIHMDIVPMFWNTLVSVIHLDTLLNDIPP